MCLPCVALIVTDCLPTCPLIYLSVCLSVRPSDFRFATSLRSEFGFPNVVRSLKSIVDRMTFEFGAVDLRNNLESCFSQEVSERSFDHHGFSSVVSKLTEYRIEEHSWLETRTRHGRLVFPGSSSFTTRDFDSDSYLWRQPSSLFSAF